MPALTFDKNELGNLEYSLQREMLATDRRGGYMSTTIVCCNTRRYHGLMVAPINESDETYVLLSSLDETVIQHNQHFNLALHRFKGVYEPRGHKYITDFEYTPTPSITYRVGGVKLKKEMLWIHKRTQLMIRYTLLEAKSETKLRLRPFFAFRDKHALTHANMQANGRSLPATCGVKNRIYDDFPWLYLQTNKCDAEFVAAPDWYYNFEYLSEQEGSSESLEDLLTTGYFELELKRGEQVIFSASVDEMSSAEEIEQTFEASIARRTHKIDFMSCLEHSARQFVIRRPGDRTELVAGYPWRGVEGRHTLISVGGLTLTQGYKEDCIEILDTMIRGMKDGDFAGISSAKEGVDTPLWFFYTLQELEAFVGKKFIWERYGETMKSILGAYKRGFGSTVAVHENGLVWASDPTKELTWMNSSYEGVPVAPRRGYAVEVQALWYNAVCYTLDLAKEFKDKKFPKQWEVSPELIKESFLKLFWRDVEGCLYDCVGDQGADDSIRPNMVLACALNNSMLNEEQKVGVMLIVRQHLLTPHGLRSLSPHNPNYKGTVMGDAERCAKAVVNGASWVWLLKFYVKCNLDLVGKEFLSLAEGMISDFEDDIQSACIGSISECHDADPPYAPRGAVSQAWSVGAVLDICKMVEKVRESNK